MFFSHMFPIFSFTPVDRFMSYAIDIPSIVPSIHPIYFLFIMYSYMGASQNRRSGTSSGTTPVPYPRSIPPFHTSLKDPFHTSVPYLWSIRYYISIYNYIYNYVIIIYIYNYLYVYIFDYVQSDFTLYARIWAHVHTWVHTCKNTFTMPKPCDCVGKSVPAALTAATYFVVWW